jgi:precorrin-6B methylase 2
MIKYNNDLDIINNEYNKILIEFNNFIKIHLLPIIEKYNEPFENNIYHNDYENNDIKKSIIFLSKLSTTKNILDIGFHSGFSTLLFLISNPNIIVTSIDIVNYSYVIPCYLKIKEYFKDRINLIWGNSVEELKNLKNKFDIINIDGSENDEIISKDVENSMILANNNTFFILKKNIYKLFNDNIITKNFNEIIKDNEKIFLYEFIEKSNNENNNKNIYLFAMDPLRAYPESGDAGVFRKLQTPDNLKFNNLKKIKNEEKEIKKNVKE